MMLVLRVFLVLCLGVFFPPPPLLPRRSSAFAERLSSFRFGTQWYRRPARDLDKLPLHVQSLVDLLFEAWCRQEASERYRFNVSDVVLDLEVSH